MAARAHANKSLESRSTFPCDSIIPTLESAVELKKEIDRQVGLTAIQQEVGCASFFIERDTTPSISRFVRDVG